MTLNKFVYCFGIVGKSHQDQDTSFLTKGQSFLIENIIPVSASEQRFTEIIPRKDRDDVFFDIPENLGGMKFIGTKTTTYKDNPTPVIMVGPNWHPVQSNWYGVSYPNE